MSPMWIRVICFVLSRWSWPGSPASVAPAGITARPAASRLVQATTGVFLRCVGFRMSISSLQRFMPIPFL